MKKLLALLFVLCFAISAFPQGSSKEAKIRQLMEVTGVSKVSMQVIDNSIQTFRSANPGKDDAFWNEFRKQVNASELIDLIIPIYSKYFTENDLDQILKFYDSPVGKKVIQTLPQVMQEAMVAGQEWGRRLSIKVQEKLSATENEQ